MFMSLSRFEFIFVHGGRVCSDFIDLHVAANLPNTPEETAHFIFLPPL